MSPTVLGTPPSTRTQRVLLTLEELGIEYELKNVDLGKGQHHVSQDSKQIHTMKAPAHHKNTGPRIRKGAPSFCQGSRFSRLGLGNLRVQGHFPLPSREERLSSHPPLWRC